MTAATITDFQLLSGAAKIPLPIIKVEIRPTTLFVAGPFLIIGSYYYFLMYLTHLRRMVKNLITTHPQIEDWRLYPWVFNMRNWFARTVAFIAEYPLPAAVVGALWYRSLVLHNVMLSSVLSAMTLLALVHFSVLFFKISRWTIAPRVAGWGLVALFFAAAGLVGWNMPLLMDENAILKKSTESQSFYQGLLFREANLALISADKAGFIDTYLTGANLTGASMPETKFLGANMRGARLLAANLEGSDFSRVPGKRPTDLSKANLTDANLSRSNLREAILKETMLRGVDLTGADLRWANLAGANLQEAKLQGAKLQGTNLEGADLRGTDLEGALMTGTDLRKADLERAILKDADLRWADLGQAIFRRADLQGANLKESIMLGTDFEGALNTDPAFFEGALMDDKTVHPDGTRGPILTTPSKKPKGQGSATGSIGPQSQ
jgi:uncharacterized protein YjbI with pentapeptide repeats